LKKNYFIDYNLKKKLFGKFKLKTEKIMNMVDILINLEKLQGIGIGYKTAWYRPIPILSKSGRYHRYRYIGTTLQVIKLIKLKQKYSS
jgi:hypothetical protein